LQIISINIHHIFEYINTSCFGKTQNYFWLSVGVTIAVFGLAMVDSLGISCIEHHIC